ncbi:hypothetical protein [Pantoea ananatis]|uniref:hypothetical protein n=1 Tax=Pantoea ananas TaxID=553 RepID=UPI0011B000BD|nr:hypothetical protein [Pantoea ananatis]
MMQNNVLSYKPTQAISYAPLLLCGLLYTNDPSSITNEFEMSGPQKVNVIKEEKAIFINDLKTHAVNTMTYISNNDSFSATEFADGISKFYASLTANQTSLDKNIEKIISESLWDLYLD